MNYIEYMGSVKGSGFVYDMNGYICIMTLTSPTTVEIALFVRDLDADIVGSIVLDRENPAASRELLAQLLQPVPLGTIRERIVDNLCARANSNALDELP